MSRKQNILRYFLVIFNKGVNMNKDYSESSNDEETYNDYFSNPLKRKQFDNIRLYQQQKELSKMSGFNKHIIEVPKKLKEPKQQKNYAVVSLCCLTVTNPFRDFIIRIVMNRWFDRFILLVIVTNCVFLALDDPQSEEQNSQFQAIVDIVFLVLYTMEMLLKIIAMGFALRPHSYLRDPWNVLDFIVVIMGWLSSMINSSNVSAIRVVRILRPLRTINSLKGMKQLVESLLNSLPTLFDILILFIFVLIMCGTVATQLFGGALLNRCAYADQIGEIISVYEDQGGDEFLCLNNSTCPLEGLSCIEVGNPNFGVTSFDNILNSVLTVFIIITLEGWTDTMYMVRQSTGQLAYDLFFIVCVVFGTFFVLNLMIAVQFSYLQSSFDDEKKGKGEDGEDEDEDESIDKSPQAKKDNVGPVDFTGQINDMDNKDQISIEESPDSKKQAPKKGACCQWGINFQKKIFDIVDSKAFQLAVIFLIVFNTITLAIEHNNMTQFLVNILYVSNIIFTILFTIEMLLKLIGLGIMLYVKDGFNDFDAIIVLISLLEFFNLGASGITVLRAFRLLRIFKIINRWPTLKKLLQTVISSFAQITYLGLLMFLLVFIYALIGMQFFSDDLYDKDGVVSRYSFASFEQSLITIFIILTGENWNEIMYIVIRRYGFGASFYFVSLIVFGNFMLLNLFLAILLKYISDNVSDDITKKDEGEDEEDSLGDDDLDLIQRTIKEQNKNPAQISRQIRSSGDEVIANVNDISVQFNKEEDTGRQDQTGGVQLRDLNQDLPEAQQDEFRSSQLSKSLKKKGKGKSAEFYKINIQGNSLFILSTDSCIRRGLKALVEHPYFENLIYYFIGLNSLLLALDEPDLMKGYQKSTIYDLIFIISIVFIIEATLKIIVMGFICGPLSYLKDPWNILDFTIVVFTLVNWTLESTGSVDVSFMRGFRALRALRPLRMVSKNVGMKTVVNSLLKSIPQLMNVLLISLLFYLVFGILGVQVFKGAIGWCTDETITYKEYCKGEFILETTGNLTDREWFIPFNNYDNIFYAMVTFFEVSTLEMWSDVMFNAIDSTGPDQGPKLNNKPYVAVLFIVFIFITTFFVMNLFISVIVDKFNEEIKRKEGAHNFTDEQKEWVKMQRIMVTVNVKVSAMPPKQKWRKIFFTIVQNPKFEYFIAFAIVLNTIILCMEFYDAPENYQNYLDLSNNAFVFIFMAEATLKIIGYGLYYYFYENWNKFDFMIVILSTFSLNEALMEGFNVTALRIIRVARLLRMIKTSKGLRHLLKTLWLSLSNILNVSMLLFLILFTFAVAGMDLFGENEFGEFYNKNANFKTFYMSLMSLVRASTGENWNGIMHDTYEKTGIVSIVYWLIFMLVSFFVFLNVFIAVIYENFNDIKSSEDANEVLSLKRKDIKSFIRAWAVFNQRGELYMKTVLFHAFLFELPPPLGYNNINIETSKLNKIIFCLNIRDHKGKVYFPEVMWAIFHSIIGNNDEKVHNCYQVINIMRILKRKYKGLGKNVTPDSLCGNKFYKNDMTISKYLSALKIVERWRKLKKIREEEKLNPRKSMPNFHDIILQERNRVQDISEDKPQQANAQDKKSTFYKKPDRANQEEEQKEEDGESSFGVDESLNSSESKQETSVVQEQQNQQENIENTNEENKEKQSEENKEAEIEEMPSYLMDEDASNSSAREQKLRLEGGETHENFTVLQQAVSKREEMPAEDSR